MHHLPKINNHICHASFFPCVAGELTYNYSKNNLKFECSFKKKLHFIPTVS